MQTINDVCKDIKTHCKNPRRDFAGNPSFSVAYGHCATIFQIPPDIAGLPSAVAWSHPTAEGVPSTIARFHRHRVRAGRQTKRALEIQDHLYPSRPARRPKERCCQHFRGGMRNNSKWIQSWIKKSGLTLYETEIRFIAWLPLNPWQWNYCRYQ